MADDTQPGVTQDGVGGFLQGVGQFLTGSNNPLTNAMMVPAIGTAIQQYHNAGQYTDLGNQAAARADPFGNNGNRQQYIDQLSSLYKDPSQIQNTPGYKFALNQSLDATSSKLASQGYLGSTQMQNALATEASGLAQQTWNTEANRLAMLGGAQFDPANAANMQMKGGQLAVDAQNGALASLFAPFAAGTNGKGITINNNNGGGSTNRGGSTAQALQRAVANGSMDPNTAAQLFNKIMSNPGDITPADQHLMESLGIQTPFDNGGVDYAGGGYDSSGFGGYGTAAGDPTLQGINFGGNYDPTSYNDIFGGGYDALNGGGIDMSGFQNGSTLNDLFGG